MTHSHHSSKYSKEIITSLALRNIHIVESLKTRKNIFNKSHIYEIKYLNYNWLNVYIFKHLHKCEYFFASLNKASITHSRKKLLFILSTNICHHKPLISRLEALDAFTAILYANTQIT